MGAAVRPLCPFLVDLEEVVLWRGEEVETDLEGLLCGVNCIESIWWRVGEVQYCCLHSPCSILLGVNT
jgi:hypothetical protein